MLNFGIEVGETATFAKTVGESDIYLFAGISGDLSPNHVNDQFMKETGYGGRIAHGLLSLAFSSTTSTIVAAKSLDRCKDHFPVSLGYDRVRFLKPVSIGDTITVRYTVVELNQETQRSRAKVEALNQSGETVMVAEHIMKWLKRSRGGYNE
jgi:3-hydroxybutyryl-CoA dehydratase